MLSPLDFGCTKTVYHGFSETGFYLKYKSYFLVRKHQVFLENTYRITPTAIFLHRTKLCAAVSPP